MDDYEALSERGRLGRIRRLAEQAAAAYGLGGSSISFVADSFNTLYRLRHSNGDFLLRVSPALRIHPQGSERAEAAWLNALRADTAIPVAQAVELGDSLVFSATAPGLPEARNCMLFTWVPGRPLSTDLTLDLVRRCGHLLATLHEHGAGWDHAALGFVPVLSEVLHFTDPDLLDGPGPYRSLFLEAADRAQTVLDTMWASPPHRPHVLHGDFTPNNLIAGRRHVIPIDFQDLAVGFEIQDVATSLMPLYAHDDIGELAIAFQAGYSQRRQWPVSDPETLDALFAARRLMMANLTLNIRKPGYQAHLGFFANRLAAWMATPE